MNQNNFENKENYGKSASEFSSTVTNNDSLSQPATQSYERIETAANIFGLDIFDHSGPVEQPQSPNPEPEYQSKNQGMESSTPQQNRIATTFSSSHQNQQMGEFSQPIENATLANNPVITPQEPMGSIINTGVEPSSMANPMQQVPSSISEPEYQTGIQGMVIPTSTGPVNQQEPQNILQNQTNTDFIVEAPIENAQVTSSVESNQSNIQTPLQSNFDKLMEQPPISDVNHDEELLETFIGPNFDKITKKRFNFSGLFLGPIYLCYRKLFLYGFLLYLIESVLITISNYIYGLIIGLLVGFFVNKFYVGYAKKKVNKIKTKYSDKTFEEVKHICANKGRTSVGLAILCVILGIIAVIVLSFGTFLSFFLSLNKTGTSEDRDASLKVITSVETAVQQKKTLDAYFKIPTKCMVNESATACDWDETVLGGTAGSLDMSYQGDIPFDAVICFDQNGKATTTPTCQTHIDFGDGAYVMDKNGLLSDQPIS